MDISNPYMTTAAVALTANIFSWFVGMTCPMREMCGECPTKFYMPPGSVFRAMWLILYTLLAFTTVRAYYSWALRGDSASLLTMVTGVLMYILAQHYVFMASPTCFDAPDMALYDLLMILALAYMHLLGVYTTGGPLMACAAVPMVVWLTMALQMHYVRVS